jgi:hypothetical protein
MKSKITLPIGAVLAAAAGCVCFAVYFIVDQIQRDVGRDAVDQVVCPNGTLKAMVFTKDGGGLTSYPPTHVSGSYAASRYFQHDSIDASSLRRLACRRAQCGSDPVW